MSIIDVLTNSQSFPRKIEAKLCRNISEHLRSYLSLSISCKAKMQAISPRENVQEISSAKSVYQNSQKGPNWKW